MFKGSKKKPKWIFKFTREALYFTKKWLRRIHTIDVMPEAKKAITYDFELEEVKQPKYTKEEENRFIHSEGLRKYSEGAKERPELITWITVMLIIVNIAMTFLLVQRFM